jgi:hypothetical protein
MALGGPGSGEVVASANTGYSLSLPSRHILLKRLGSAHSDPTGSDVVSDAGAACFCQALFSAGFAAAFSLTAASGSGAGASSADPSVSAALAG